MNVAGLNNLGFAQGSAPAAKPAAPKSTPASTSGRDLKKSSFEDALGSARAKASPQDARVGEEAARDRRNQDHDRDRGRDGGNAKREDAPTRAPAAAPAPRNAATPKAAAPPSAKTPAASKDSVAQRSASAGSPRTEGPRTEGPRKDAPDSPEETSVDGENLPGQSISFAGGPQLQDRVAPNAPNAVTLPTANGAKSGPAGNQEDGVDSLTRRVVWSDFLRKMKDDLGVSAEDVMKAFNSLSAEDLAKPPAETVDNVVMALGLNDQQQLLAKQYFQDLIQKTQSRSLGEELKSSGGKQINLSLMSQRELDRKTQQSALDRFNQNFFMKGPFARPAAAANATPNGPQRLDGKTDQMLNDAAGNDQEIDPRLVAMTSGNGAIPAAALPGAAGGNGAGGEVAAQNPSPAQKLAQANSAKALNEMTAHMKPTAAGDDRNVDQLVQKFINSQAPSGLNKTKAQAMMSAGGAEANAGALATNAASTPQSAPMMSAASMNGLLAALKDGDQGVDEDAASGGGGNGLSDASYLNAPMMTGDAKLNAPINSGQDFQAQLAKANPGAPMTVPDLVQQAQIMVKDGGGEMKVTMHPEGLGEVAMKVTVDQGKVTVQMITESDEAKKLIEHQLGELKTSLASNHLHVGDIKVDTASNLGKQLEQQYHDAQRQSTQQQWEQFRQDNQGWRKSYFDTGSARQYKGESQATRDVQEPTSSSAAARARGVSKRLDLVA